MIRKRRIEIEEEIPPFVMMRIGIFEHIDNGSMTADMYLIYSRLLHLVDWETGIWEGCAAKLATEMNNIWHVKKFERVLKLLVDGKYIESHYKKGDYGNYAILINNFIPTKGPNALSIKLRQVQAGNQPTPSDNSVPKTVAAVVGGATILSPRLSEGSDKNVLGVGAILSEGATILSPKLSTIQEDTRMGQDAFPDGIDGCVDSSAARKFFDEEEV